MFCGSVRLIILNHGEFFVPAHRKNVWICNYWCCDLSVKCVNKKINKMLSSYVVLYLFLNYSQVSYIFLKNPLHGVFYIYSKPLDAWGSLSKKILSSLE